jgi:hypothetical protein
MKTSILLLFFSICAMCAVRQQAEGAKGFTGITPADVPSGGAINGSSVDGAARMIRIVGSTAPNQTLRLAVVRGSGTSARRSTISVVIGSSDAAPASAIPAPQIPPLLVQRSQLPPAASNGGAALVNPEKPLAVSAYVRTGDPLEQAFTVEVPPGWRSEVGLARRSALQINAYVRSLSPDKMTYLIIGEPTMPAFVPPSQMGNAIGYREGKLYDSGLGGITMVMHYMPGAEFARAYGETALVGLCPALKVSSVQNRPDLAHKAETWLPTVIPSRYDGGEARFSCTHNKQVTEVRVDAATRSTRDNIGWSVLLLWAFLAPPSQANSAEEILNHIVGSFNFNQIWIQKQNNLSAEAASQINRRMQEIFRQQQSFMQKLNSVDENFESVDELISGYSTYHDAATGNNYSLTNVNPNKWIDPGTGRIISTPTNSKPVWASGYAPLSRGSQ